MPTPPGFADCSLEFTLTGSTRPAYITFGVDPQDTDPSVVADSVFTATTGAGSLMSAMDSSVTLTAVRVSLGTDGAEDLIYERPTSTPGAISGNAPPANVAVLVHKTTTRGGRRGRGRMFIPWCVTTAAIEESGLLVAGSQAALQTKMETWRIALSTNLVTMVLLHGPSLPGVAHPTTPGAPNPVTALRVDKLISGQRRRLGR